jgi:enoyl-CoA hydratase/carnithine racemase
MNDAVLLGGSDGVAVGTLNRPDGLNTVSGELMDGLTEAVRSAADDPNVGRVVVTGAGLGFCAGGDTKEGASRRADGTPPPPELVSGASLRRGAEFTGEEAYAFGIYNRFYRRALFDRAYLGSPSLHRERVAEMAGW